MNFEFRRYSQDEILEKKRYAKKMKSLGPEYFEDFKLAFSEYSNAVTCNKLFDLDESKKKGDYDKAAMIQLELNSAYGAKGHGFGHNLYSED